MFLRRVAEFISYLIFVILIGVLFMALPSVRYTPDGIMGTSNALWTCLSILYFIVLPLISVPLGKRHLIGTYCAMTVCLLYFVVSGIIVYLGTSNQFGVYPFYVLIAPYTPFIASVADTFSLDTATAYLTLLFPLICLTMSFISYLVSHNKANKIAIEGYYDELRMHNDTDY